ncbi:transglutaminase-like domain-containing protein [Nisaea acidiphila]|uniref:Transglutaminase-like domain-containing protein n=1 Tax=Nisaea acidiphila TaxID=1862145 RepID=A0A9J7AYL9_9PROT|nr:transglutaminase-like domain-containing protein [Nisaea acidiphila]UUX52166.1 transglutaminase-like domain-containing protein [Nisaea acidiphila]
MIPDPESTRASLERIGKEGLAAEGLAEAALLLASLDRPGVPLDRYREQLDSFSESARARGESSPAAALAETFAGEFGFAGDEKTYDDPQNANLIRVIDRRKGLPVALGILYIATARALGLDAGGLNFPNHFLIRVQDGGARQIIDPFNGGAVLDARDLRRLLTSFQGEQAELSQAHYRDVSDLDILLRLQNNIKLRLLRNGKLEPALRVIRDMRLLAPGLPSLMREEGLLLARKGERRAAIGCLRDFLATDNIPEPERLEVARMLQVLESQLN